MSVIYNWVGVLELLCVSAGIVGVGSRASKDRELTFAFAVFARKKVFFTLDRMLGIRGNLFIMLLLHAIYGGVSVVRRSVGGCERDDGE